MNEPNEDEAKTPKRVRALRSAEDLFHHGSVDEQVTLQISLLTQAVTESMIYASGAIPEPEIEEEIPQQQYWHRPLKQPNFSALRFEARSRQLQDAARLSIATASLVGALSQFSSQQGQRFTTRHTVAPDPAGKQKPKRVTTITHTLFAPREHCAPDDTIVEAAPRAADPQ